MSYSISIWDPSELNKPLPASFKEACEVFEYVSSRPGKPNPRMISLARQLSQLYPSFDSYPRGDPAAEEAIFLSNPVQEASESQHALWSLDVPTGASLRVLRDTVRFAKPLGLAVMDDQLGIYFDPKKGVMPPAMRETWEVVNEELDEPQPQFNKAYVSKRFDQQLHKMLLPHGFKRVKKETFSYFERELEDGNQQISFRLTGQIPRFSVRVDLSVDNYSIRNIYNTVFPGEEFGCAYSAVLESFGYNSEEAEYVRNENDILGRVRLIEVSFIPFLDRCKKTRDIDWLLNTDEGQLFVPEKKRNKNKGNGQPVVMCIAAWLMRNPRFDQIVAEEIVRYENQPFLNEKSRQTIIGWIKQIAEYLRKNVQPLEVNSK